MESGAAEVPIGALRGYIDVINNTRIAGWAQNVDYPEAPVCLDIYVNDCLIGQVLANRHREDLKLLGIGTEYHSFEFVPTPGLRCVPSAVAVRRSLDGAELSFVGRVGERHKAG